MPLAQARSQAHRDLSGIKAKVSDLAFTLDLPADNGWPSNIWSLSLLEKYKPGHRDQPQDPPPRIEIDSHGYERSISGVHSAC